MISEPWFSVEQQRGLDDFWRVYDAHYDDILVDTLKAARSHPEFAPIIDAMSPEQMELQNQRSRKLLGDAVAGDWATYESDLRAQGSVYAQMGIGYRAWHDIVRGFSKYLIPVLVKSYGETPERLTGALISLQTFLGRAMAIIGEEYLATKERIIAEGAARTAAILEAALDPILTMDHQGTILEFNPAAERTFGHRRQDVIGKPLAEVIIPPAMREAHDSGLARYLATRKAGSMLGQRTERVALRADGTEIPVEIAIIRIADEEPPRFTGFIRDLTDRKRAEEALRRSLEENRRLEAEAAEQALQRSEERFRLLVASVKDYAILLLDPEGRVDSWNEGAERINGWRAEEIVGQPISRFYLPEDVAAKKPERELENAIAHGRSEDEGWRVRKDGSRFWANVIVAPLYEDDGTLRGFAKVTRDFTERKKAEEEIQRANRAKSDFLAMMSHELRTPLNSIIGFSEVLIDGKFGQLNERQSRYLNNVHASGRHLLGLINDLLDLSKIEAGRLEVALHPCSPRLILTEALATLQPAADAAKVELVVKPGAAGSSDAVAADAVRFKQVLYNLLSNAIKFTPPGGRVRVGTETIGARVRISIEDSGGGISAEDLPRLFVPFTQLENAKDKSGTGLGLALTRELVELMGGRIGVDSPAGAGATFYIELERVEPAPAPAAAGSLEIGSDSPLALIVDDDREAQELLALALHSHGYRTIVAATGEDALALARRVRPQVITLDVFLPTIDGWDVLRILRTDPGTADIPVVMVTISSDRRTAFALGAVEHLVKPINQQSLMEALGRHSFTTKVRQRPVHILVVDDDSHQLELVRAALEPHGFLVRTELTGRAGLQAALSAPVDLLLLDLVMPDLSGIEVIQALRESPSGGKIPIILVTGQDITPEVRARLKGEVEAILAKNEFHAEQLVERINAVLHRDKELTAR
jgi:PAS domain S-box-containing protein